MLSYRNADMAGEHGSAPAKNAKRSDARTAGAARSAERQAELLPEQRAMKVFRNPVLRVATLLAALAALEALMIRGAK